MSFSDSNVFTTWYQKVRIEVRNQSCLKSSRWTYEAVTRATEVEQRLRKDWDEDKGKDCCAELSWVQEEAWLLKVIDNWKRCNHFTGAILHSKVCNHLCKWEVRSAE